jgi:hypothetical protein
MSISLPLDKYRADLVIALLYPRAGQDATKLLTRAIKLLKEKKVNTDSIRSFIDKITGQLQSIYNASADGMKWAHVSMLLVVLAQLKARL